KFSLNAGNHFRGHLCALRFATTFLRLSLSLTRPVSTLTTVTLYLPAVRRTIPPQNLCYPPLRNILMQQRINLVTFSFGELAVQHSHRALLE
ncbi:MAG: hypothetical protein V1800_11285, partial [Candidatus Latescibacterota bacterium]